MPIRLLVLGVSKMVNRQGGDKSSGLKMNKRSISVEEGLWLQYASFVAS